MLSVAGRNAIVHRIVSIDANRIRCPQGRRPKLSTAYLLDRIFFVCRTGCQWSHLPVENSSYKTVYHYFSKWSKARVFEDAFYAMVRARPTKNTTLIADTSFVKNVHGTQVLGRNPTDRGRKATKVSLLTDKQGTPLCTVFHKANKNDCLTLRHLLNTAARKTDSVRHYRELLADKGYDSQDCRGVCSAFGLTSGIPHRRTRDTDPRRYAVEQTFGILDQFRRIRVRYDALISHFKSFHYFAMIQIIGNR
jgi:putative transposase